MRYQFDICSFNRGVFTLNPSFKIGINFIQFFRYNNFALPAADFRVKYITTVLTFNRFVCNIHPSTNREYPTLSCFLISLKHAILNPFAFFPFWIKIPELIILKIRNPQQHQRISNEKFALPKAALLNCEANVLLSFMVIRS